MLYLQQKTEIMAGSKNTTVLSDTRGRGGIKDGIKNV